MVLRHMNAFREDTMTRRFALGVLALAAVSLAPAVRLFAHEGHEHKVLGAVTMAAADHIMLTTTAGKDVTIRVTKDTKVRSTPPMKVEDIKPGTRVVVTAVTDKSTTTAKVIQVAPARPK